MQWKNIFLEAFLNFISSQKKKLRSVLPIFSNVLIVHVKNVRNWLNFFQDKIDIEFHIIWSNVIESDRISNKSHKNVVSFSGFLAN